MKNFYCLASLFILMSLTNVKAVNKIDARTFYRPKLQTSFSLSPNGQYIAFVGQKNNHDAIFIREADCSTRTCVSDTTKDTRNFFWGNNQYLLYLADNKGDENYKLYRINIHTGETKSLTDYENVRTRIINRQANNSCIAIALNKRDRKIFDPYLLNINTGELKFLYKNPGNIRSWVVDNQGVIRFAVSNVLMYRNDTLSEFKEVMKFNSAADIFTPKYFTPDNRYVYAYSNIDRDKVAIVEFDPNAGKEVKVIFEDAVYDAFGDDEKDYFEYSASNNKLLYANYTTEKRTLKFFDKRLEKVYKEITNKIGKAYDIDIVSYCDDFSKIILKACSDKVGGRYYLYSEANKKLEKLGDDSPWLEESELAPTEPISYKARDGQLIHGYLTLPKDIQAKNLPLVVMPHGGPQWRDSWKFDEKCQHLANRGYAILQVNYRGSTGYGKAFTTAGYRQWGLRSQDDVTDGVHWLIDQGIADKKRIAICGASAGGYMVLAGLTFTPELYACGIDLWGIANFFTFYRSLPPYFPMKEIYERWGDIKKDSVQLYNTSPALHANQIKAPLFIVQGVNDVRVARGQSDEMVEALKKNNKEVEYLLLKDVGHGVPDEILLQIMLKVEDFLEKNMGAKKQ